MTSRIVRVVLVALVVVLAGLNWFQWRQRTRQGPVQDLPPAEGAVVPAPSPPAATTARARNLVLLIGDGMGVAHVAAASLRSGDDRARLEMERMPVTGLVRTHSAYHLVTDSAAAATALSTGVRTRNQVLGLDPDGRPREHLLAAAAMAGRATGLLTTDEITGATPAGFIVHVESRDDRIAIAEKLTGAPLDLMIGGGRDLFSGRGLLNVARAKGFEIARNAEELAAAGPGRLFALLTPGPLGDRPDAFDLAALTETALERLGSGPDGFVLVVEDTHIDWRSHEWKATDATDRVLALDRAVGAVRRFASRTPGTLVLVMADHESGGLAVTTRERSPRKPVAAWVTQGHTAAPVAIYAEGPGAESFTGVMHLTDVARKMRAVLGLGPVGEAAWSVERLQEVRVIRARTDLDAYRIALRLFRLEHRRYPTTAEGLPKLTETSAKFPEGFVERFRPDDPWGRPYLYECDGESFSIVSLGADGREGGEGADADIRVGR